jgi:hypothetical protein
MWRFGFLVVLSFWRMASDGLIVCLTAFQYRQSYRLYHDVELAGIWNWIKRK